MTKIVFTLLFFFTLNVVSFSQNINCSRITNFGESEICLPVMEGYVECYSDPVVKQMADMTEIAINYVLGFYLDEETFQQKDKLGMITFDNYLKFYATNELANYDADQNTLAEIKSVLSGNFFAKSWEELIDEHLNEELNVEIGVPTMIRDYEVNEHSFTYLMITKFETEGQEATTLAMSMTGILANKRLIWMAYYLDYENETSIDILQENTNELVLNFMNSQRP